MLTIDSLECRSHALFQFFRRKLWVLRFECEEATYASAGRRLQGYWTLRGVTFEGIVGEAFGDPQVAKPGA
jgi:hypothetical protein